MTEIAPPAEAVLNGDGEVMVMLPDAPPEVLGWAAGPGSVLRLRLPGGRHAAVTLPGEALSAAASNGRLLLVSPGPDGRPLREGWVFAD